MRVLVTGGCGYIGSHTIIDLLDNGFQVISVDNFSNSSPNVIPIISDISKKNLVNHNLDIKDFEKMDSIFSEFKPECVIHFAAFKSVPESVQSPLKYWDNNINTTLNLLSLSDKWNVKKFVFSSSCSVYGEVNKLPVSENDELKDPKSPYANTKRVCEEIIKEFSKNSQIEFTILRYFNPVGFHQSGKLNDEMRFDDSLISKMILSHRNNSEFLIYGNDYDTKDGTPVRDFIHVSDIASGHTKSINRLTKEKIEIFNLGTGTGVSVLEMIKEFSKITGKEINYKFLPRRKGDIGSIFASNEKSKALLNWKPLKTTEDILKSII
jgi:UDP-glucose 4-epimerase